MAEQSVTPSSGKRAPARQSGDPFSAFRREMDRLFDDFFTGSGFSPPWLFGASEERAMAPAIETSETDREICISAELPGIDEKDIEVSVSDDLLTIRAKKEAERDEQDRDYHFTERSYGTFVRTLRLPFAADPEHTEASYRNGVLTITLPKPEQRDSRRRIEVKGAAGGEQRVELAAAGSKPGAAEGGSAAGQPSAGNESGSAPKQG